MADRDRRNRGRSRSKSASKERERTSKTNREREDLKENKDNKTIDREKVKIVYIFVMWPARFAGLSELKACDNNREK